MWKAVVGYEGLYCVNERGEVLTERSSRLMRPFQENGGYWYVNLSKDKRARKRLVHVLVLEAFVGPRPPGYHGCHNDGQPSNRALSNLRWDTPKGNHADKRAHGTWQAGEKASRVTLTNELVEWIKESPQNSLALAPILGVASSTVRAVRIGQNWATTA